MPGQLRGPVLRLAVVDAQASAEFKDTVGGCWGGGRGVYDEGWGLILGALVGGRYGHDTHGKMEMNMGFRGIYKTTNTCVV